MVRTNVKGALLVRHWVVTTCGLSPCPGFPVTTRISLFLIGNHQSQPKPSFATGIRREGGHNPNMKLKTLVEKQGGHLRPATDLMLVLCSNRMLLANTNATQNNQKQQQNLPQRYHISFQKFILGSHKARQKYASTHNLQGEKNHPLHPGRLVNPSDVQGVDAQICARWVR